MPTVNDRAPLWRLLIRDRCAKMDLQPGCVPNAFDFVDHSAAALQLQVANRMASNPATQYCEDSKEIKSRNVVSCRVNGSVK